MFRIRNFGADVHCVDLDNLELQVQAYRGQSITIDDRRPLGGLHYFDISETGRINESYASRRIVDLRLLLETLGRPVYP
jgi:hypothetical protein